MSVFVRPVRSARPAKNQNSQQNVVAADAEAEADIQTEDDTVLAGESSQHFLHVDAEEESSGDETQQPQNRFKIDSAKDNSGSSHSEKHRSLRNQHLDDLLAVLHMCILDGSWLRAERAYGLLLRSKGVDIRLCYDLGLDILNHTDPSGVRSMEFLARLIIAYPPIKPRKGKRSYDRADVFVRLLVDLRMKHGEYRIALQELENWLLVPPYKDDRALWAAQNKICEALELEAKARKDRFEAEQYRRKRLKAESKMRELYNGTEEGIA